MIKSATIDAQAKEAAISCESDDVHATQNDIQQNSIDDNTSLTHWPSHITKKLIVIWLDPNMNESDSAYQNSIIQLQHVVNSVQIFTDVDQCVDFLTEVEATKIFLIISDTIYETVVPFVHDTPQLDSIYIFCYDKTKHEEWTIEWKKLKGIFTDVSCICDQLERNIKQYEQDLIPISVTSSSSAIDLNELDQSFMYSQLLKETLLEMKDDEEAKKKFFQFCRAKCSDNPDRLKRIDKFEQDYNNYSPIWWYNQELFICSMLNRALETQDIASIIKMGFYIRALHQEIERVHAATNQIGKLTVYRGKVKRNAAFEEIAKSAGRLISFNQFLAATVTSDVACCYADNGRENSQSVGVIFQIKIDPSISTTSYAVLDDINKFGSSEKEVLFSMHTVFRIGDIEQVTNNLWAVTLTLTSETDQELYQLTERIREEMGGSSGLHRLGNLLIKMGEFDKAEEVFQTLLNATLPDDLKQNVLLYAQLGDIHQKKGDFSNALIDFRKALEIQLETHPPNHIDLANIYNNIGRVHASMGEYSTALSYYDEALEIQQRSLPSDHPDLATIYNNIGRVHLSMGEYSTALTQYEKTLEIQQKSLPLNHPDLATTYKNIGEVHDSMGNYSTALSCYEKTVEIQQKSLPPNHPELATTYKNIGQVCHSRGDYPTAFSYYEKTLAIQRISLPPNHPDLATTYNHIGRVRYSMEDYSNALSDYEKTLAIQRISLPPNHPDLATTYNHIGRVRYSMEDYSNALSDYEKTLEIQQKSLPPNHPDLAVTYNNIGEVHYSMKKYSSALSCYQKTLEMYEKTLPRDHPDFAVPYNNIGRVRFAMKDYTAALFSFKKTMKNQQVNLPSDHPLLAITYNNIGQVHELREKYSDALYYFEKALKIQKKAIPPNYPLLAKTCNSVSEMHRLAGNYASALSYYQETLGIQLKCLPSNHPSLAVSHHNIAMVLEGLHRYKEAVEHTSQAINITRCSYGSPHPQVQKFQEYLNQLSLMPGCSELVEISDNNKRIYSSILVLHVPHKSRLYPILKELTDSHLMLPMMADECLSELESRKQVKNIVFEISDDSTDKRDRLLSDFSSIDHIESIYLLGKPPETSEQRKKFFTRFHKVCMFCDDEGHLAVRWALDTANECRTLDLKYNETGETNSSREYFQRSAELYDRLANFMNKMRRKVSST